MDRPEAQKNSSRLGSGLKIKPALRKLKMYDSVHDGNDRREQVHSKGDKTITAKGIPVVLLETIAREDSQNSQQKRCITN